MGPRSIEARSTDENRRITGRIQGIFDVSPLLYTVANGTVRISVFERTSRLGEESIFLERAEEACLAEDPSPLGSALRFITIHNDAGLAFPIFYFEYASSGRLDYCTSPYGNISSVAEGVDREIYLFDSHNYLFGSQGDGCKLENIMKSPVGKNRHGLLRLLGVTDIDKIPKLSFTPDPENSRRSTIAAGDYEFIDGLLTQVEKGRYEEQIYSSSRRK